MKNKEKQSYCREKCNEYQIYLCDLCEERPKCVGLALKAISNRLKEIQKEESK